jgi:hypothetical protein
MQDALETSPHDHALEYTIRCLTDNALTYVDCVVWLLWVFLLPTCIANDRVVARHEIEHHIVHRA